MRTIFGGQTLPNTVNGVRYLPPDLPGQPQVVNVTIPLGTALVSTPVFIFGERFDNGTVDSPTDPFIDAYFAAATIRITFNGNVLLDGPINSFPERKYGISLFPEPIPYSTPQPRGPGLNAIAATYQGGITAIYDMLPIGKHTIREEFNSTLVGPDSITYNITVVPEPIGLIPVGIAAISFIGYGRRRSRRDSA
jgi:hypothetical protein